MNDDKALTDTTTAVPAVTTSRIPDDLTNLAEIFGRFLRLYVAEGDASPATMRTYHTQAAQFVAWCRQGDLDPAIATEADIIAYRKRLIEAGDPLPAMRRFLIRGHWCHTVTLRSSVRLPSQ